MNTNLRFISRMLIAMFGRRFVHQVINYFGRGRAGGKTMDPNMQKKINKAMRMFRRFR